MIQLITQLTTVLVMFLTVLMLIAQNDVWLLVPLAGGIIVINTLTMIYEVEHIQRRALR